MYDLSNVKRGMINGFRLAGASMSRTANLVGVLRTPVGKVSSVNHRSGRKLKLKDRERRVFKRIGTRKRKTILPQITSEMNTHFYNPVYMKTIQRELHAANTYMAE
ncbi:uncharacterized protein TNCV_1134031 [Trichonephila clavipes]|nr:uncharacterized protein TNCV_1134031 [Trichonephila clavipes]